MPKSSFDSLLLTNFRIKKKKSVTLSLSLFSHSPTRKELWCTKPQTLFDAFNLFDDMSEPIKNLFNGLRHWKPMSNLARKLNGWTTNQFGSHSERKTKMGFFTGLFFGVAFGLGFIVCIARFQIIRSARRADLVCVFDSEMISYTFFLILIVIR